MIQPIPDFLGCMAFKKDTFAALLIRIVFLSKSNQYPTVLLGQSPQFAPFHGKTITFFLYMQIILYKQFYIFRAGPEIRGYCDGGQRDVHVQGEVVEVLCGPVVAGGGDVGA